MNGSATSARLRRATIAAIAATLVTLAAARHDVLAATAPEPAVGDLTGTAEPFPASSYIRDLVERAQRALAALGLYDGPVSGTVDDQLTEAIRRFETRNNLPDTAIIDEDLVQRLESSVNVEQLLQRLNAARERDSEKAREALLANPETRDLLDPNAVEEPANPTRDASACFDAPSAKCLLDEAVESAKAIATDGRRDWALGEVLVAQVRAGLADDSLATVRRISDPRLIVVALRRIAEAEAAAGRSGAALSALGVIPDLEEKTAAAAAVATYLSARRIHGAAVEAAALLIGDTAGVVAAPTRYLAEIVPVLAAGGEPERAEALLVELALQARPMEDAVGRDAAYRHIALAYLALGETDVALDMLEQVAGESDRNAIVIAAAANLAASGRADEARDLARTVSGARYQAVAFVGIAEQQTRRGDRDAAIDSLKAAERMLSGIDLPYARDYAASRIALAQAGIEGGDPEATRTVADRIGDARLKAETLWRIHLLGHADFLAAAEAASDGIKGVFDRAWLFGDLAQQQVDADDREGGSQLFERALALTREVEAPWARARILARLAVTFAMIH